MCFIEEIETVQLPQPPSIQSMQACPPTLACRHPSLPPPGNRESCPSPAGASWLRLGFTLHFSLWFPQLLHHPPAHPRLTPKTFSSIFASEGIKIRFHWTRLNKLSISRGRLPHWRLVSEKDWTLCPLRSKSSQETWTTHLHSNCSKPTEN